MTAHPDLVQQVAEGLHSLCVQRWHANPDRLHTKLPPTVGEQV